MTDQYITVSELAELMGASKQAVYKRTKTSLKAYTKTVDGKTVLDRSCLDLVMPKYSTNSTQVEQPLNNPVEKENFTKIIEEQAETIKAMQTQITDLEKHIMTQSTELTELLKGNQALQNQLQHLLALPQLKELQESTETPEKVETVAEETQKKHKGLFARFKR